MDSTSPRAWIRNVPVPEAYLICLAAGFVLHAVRAWDLPVPAGPRHLLGWPLVIAGAVVVASSVREAGTVDLERPGRLVTSGPYARSRNPMYVGWALASLGAGVVAGSGWVLAALPLAAGWVHWDVLREERRLAASFGAEFVAYRARVPRYVRIPRPPGRGARPRSHKPAE